MLNKIRQDLSLGSNLRALRKKAKLTQEKTVAQMQLAGCDISRGIYSRYETGELNIRVSDLVALTKIFKCDFNSFFQNL